MSNFGYIDFEYNDDQVLMCSLRLDDGDTNTIDCRKPENVLVLKEIMKDPDIVWVSYSLGAEISSLLRLGINVENLKCVDLMVECRMITMSHRKYFTMDSSMMGQITCLLGKDTSAQSETKDDMRDLILGQNTWTEEEWDLIVKYCESDIADMRDLFLKVSEIHDEADHPYDLEAVLKRGDYVRKCSEMDFASNGFPVNSQAINNIFKNRDEVKLNLIRNLSTEWRECFVPSKNGFVLKQNLLENLVKSKGWIGWPRTDSGKLSLDTSTLKELAKRIPEVQEIRQYRQTENTLRSTDFSDKIVDGYIKPRTSAFTAVTGRNGLEPSRGYLLNLPKWIRKIIHPAKGMVLLSGDWSQQEIAVGAALSKDVNLIKAYNSGDIYVAMGKMAGMIPEDGTKDTHPVERNLVKALQLALGYGKGVRALGVDFHAIMGGGLAQASAKAREIHAWHQRAFSTYWAWANKGVQDAYTKGWVSTLDSWVSWVGSRTKKTQLLNFPMQGTGAAMMRIATLAFYDAWKKGEMPPLLCSQHDGFYFNTKEEDSEEHAKRMVKIMEQASIDTIGLLVRADTTIYNHDEGYIPKGWAERYQKVWDLCTKDKGSI